MVSTQVIEVTEVPEEHIQLHLYCKNHAKWMIIETLWLQRKIKWYYLPTTFKEYQLAVA